MAKTHVFIDGEQGTTGLQIRERLAGRTVIELITLPEAERKDEARRTQALNDCDVAILCLPDAAAREAAAWVRRDGVRIIDASSAHRTHPDWTYGLPELDPAQAARIAGASRISNPGCYPTGAITLLRPLVDAGLLREDAALAIHAVSGYSGGGRAAIDRFEGEAGDRGRPPSFQVYGLGLDHKHVPEIQQHARLVQRPIFVPAYGPYRQGIVLTIALPVGALRAGVTARHVHAALADRYADTAQVRVAAPVEDASTAILDPQALNGTNDLSLAVFDNGALGQVLLTAVFDNLGKGAAGAAVQNLDLLMAAR